jgi:hypothetical protein
MLMSQAIQPTTNLKVAACYSGFPRNYKKTFPQAKRHFHDLCSPDVFWAGYNEVNGTLDQDVLDLYRPVKSIFRDYDEEAVNEIDKEFNNYQLTRVRPGTRAEAMKSQFYNVYLANELKKEHEKKLGFKYDIVIRCRPDYYYLKDLTSNQLSLALNGDIVIPNKWDFKEVSPWGATDSFAYSTSKNMDIYSMAFYYFEKYNKEDKIMCHPETLIGYHIHKSGLKRVPMESLFEYDGDAETVGGRPGERYEFNPN